MLARRGGRPPCETSAAPFGHLCRRVTVKISERQRSPIPDQKKEKKKRRRNSRDINQRRNEIKDRKVCGMFSTTRKRDNEFVVKDLDFCHLASLYYIKVVNRIIKRATFFLYVRRPVLRPSSTTILAVTLCLCAIYVDQVFLFFSLVATISSRENSNSFL